MAVPAKKKTRSDRKYQTAADLQKAIDKYFANPDTRTIHGKGEPFESAIISMEHISYRLGFSTPQSLYDYRNRLKDEGYDDVVNGLINRVKAHWINAGEFVAGAFAGNMVSRLDWSGGTVNFKGCNTPLEKAQRIIEAGASGSITAEAMQKLMNGVKAEADIAGGYQSDAPDDIEIRIVDAVKNED
jgi:hypothetical protein